MGKDYVKFSLVSLCWSVWQAQEKNAVDYLHRAENAWRVSLWGGVLISSHLQRKAAIHCNRSRGSIRILTTGQNQIFVNTLLLFSQVNLSAVQSDFAKNSVNLTHLWFPPTPVDSGMDQLRILNCRSMSG